MQRAATITQRRATRALTPAQRTLLARPYAILGGQLYKEEHETIQNQEQDNLQQQQLQEAEGVLPDDAAGPEIIEDWKAMHEPVSGKGRLHPSIVQPEGMVKRDPKMHELPI